MKPTPAIPNGESLGLEVTTRCTGNCRYCFVRAGRSRYVSLPLKIAKSAVSEGHSIGYRRLHITGGEPLLWRGLFPLLDHAYATGYESVFLNTNGLLLSQPAAKKLSTYPDLAVSITVQGPLKTHDAFRGRGSHARALKGVENALAAGITVDIFTPVCKSLLGDLLFFAEEIYTRFPTLSCLTLIQLIRVANDVYDLSAELLDPNDFLKMVQMACMLNLSGRRTEILNNPLAVVASRLMGMPWLPDSPALHRPGRLLIMADRSIGLAHSTRLSFGTYKPGIMKKSIVSDAYSHAVKSDSFPFSFLPSYYNGIALGKISVSNGESH
jgi:MoaA/NifB/PqqE/SkfB family radical SAM enzyme